MNATKAIKVYFEQGEHGVKIDAKELLGFKKDTPADEYQELGRLACVELGETYEPPAS